MEIDCLRSSRRALFPLELFQDSAGITQFHRIIRERNQIAHHPSSALAMSQLLHLVYTGQLEASKWSEKDLVIMASLANRYLLVEERSVMMNLINKSLNKNSILSVYDAAVQYSEDGIMDMVLDYVKSHPDNLLYDVKSFIQLPYYLVHAIISSKLISIPEDHVLEFALKWLKGSEDGKSLVIRTKDIAINRHFVIHHNLLSQDCASRYAKRGLIHDQLLRKTMHDSNIKPNSKGEVLIQIPFIELAKVLRTRSWRSKPIDALGFIWYLEIEPCAQHDMAMCSIFGCSAPIFSLNCVRSIQTRNTQGALMGRQFFWSLYLKRNHEVSNPRSRKEKKTLLQTACTHPQSYYWQYFDSNRVLVRCSPLRAITFTALPCSEDEKLGSSVQPPYKFIHQFRHYYLDPKTRDLLFELYIKETVSTS